MFVELGLGVWTVAGIAWWVIAWRMVAGERTLERSSEGSAPTLGFMSIFKPLPPLGARGIAGFDAALESFISQLDDASEMLLGVHESDRAAVASFLGRMQREHPAARLNVVYRAEPDEVANPKIAWQKILSAHAQGEIWLWSDSDIIAPAGFLDSARGEFGGGDLRLLTFPYVIRGEISSAGSLDALYVNAEFYPGVLFLGRSGPIDFGLGAGLLFRRDDFLREVGWERVGEALADDFVLGQRLGPVGLSAMTLSTLPEGGNWGTALLHYLRWSRTVWWNRPAGSAARIAIMPVAGWAFWAAFHSGSLIAWSGLVAMMQVDVICGAILCRAAGCDWRARNLLASEFWSLWRPAVWAACWLPWPVSWRGVLWWKPQRK